MLDCAICVSYCVIVWGCGLVLIIACWKASMLWSSRYASHMDMVSICFVILSPFWLCVRQADGRFCIWFLRAMCLYMCLGAPLGHAPWTAFLLWSRYLRAAFASPTAAAPHPPRALRRSGIPSAAQRILVIYDVFCYLDFLVDSFHSCFRRGRFQGYCLWHRGCLWVAPLPYPGGPCRL